MLNIRYLLLILSIVSLSASCAFFQKKDQQDIQIIGSPPSANEDPFSDSRIFNDLEPAPTSGILNPENDSELNFDTSTQENNSSKNFSKKNNISGNEIEKPVVNTSVIPTMQDRVTRTHTYHCYSCIGLCYKNVGKHEKSATCSNSDEELCGWGTSSDKRSAQLMAVEQCRTSLGNITPIEDLPENSATCSLPFCDE